MKTLQLLSAMLLAGTAATTIACNRADTEATAERAAAEVRTSAARAGEQLADSWLTTKIQAQYFADEDVKARYINVSTRDGIVTLSGFVSSTDERDQAVQIAKNTDGVKRVDDRLAIAVPSQTAEAKPPDAAKAPVATTGTTTDDPRGLTDQLDDARITASVQAKFFLDDRVKARKIDVDTRQGVVTLRGEVGSEDERAQALLLARTTSGVQRVEDNLVVKAAAHPPNPAPPSEAERVTPAQTSDAEVISAVRSKLSADAGVHGATIEVTARDGVVLLQGTVPSEAIRKKALSLAQGTQGVVQVVDRLKIRARVR